jgi:ABC-type branched-subunit amino acid transport system ATPase component
MLGGIGTFEGPVAGAGVIGVLSAALPWAVAPVLADVLVFIIAIVIVEQHLDLALRVAQYAYVLDRGRVALEGPSDAIRGDPRLLQYLAP